MNYPKKIGIVGGGQLGRMMTYAAKKLGMYVTVIDPTPNSPAGQIANKQIIGGYKDPHATRELAKISDVITIDAEFVDDKTLAELEKDGKPVHPSPKTISIIKDKLLQKQFLEQSKIPVAEFKSVETADDIKETAGEFGYPLLLKAREDAYDGKGNFVIKTEKDIEEGLEKLNGRKLYVEKFVPFVKELAVMVARSTNGEIKSYPVVETNHKNNILHTVLVPALVEKSITKKAQEFAISVVKHLHGAGVFGIEMFLTKNGDVLVNEIAPRVHNSGHYTIEACKTSQFENHIRAITGMPIGDTDLIVPAAVMINVLGERHGPAEAKGLEKIMEMPNVSVHIYGKKETKLERKMGHITVVGKTVKECLEIAEHARKILTI